MEPTKAPWATKTTAPGISNLSPVSRGETTTAPWARTGPSAIPQRPLEVSIHATPRFQDPLENPETHTFQPARKQIANATLLRQFLASSVAVDYLSFALALNDAVKGRALSEQCHTSDGVTSLINLLDTLDSWVTEIPPAAHTLRYGNPSFRVWFNRLKTEASDLMASVLPSELKARSDALAELTPYLIDSFGNETRIDYGTGHETTFVAFLYCMAKVGVCTSQDAQALVTRVFDRYIRLMRRIQTTYWLEPAGSHGVWGLDDYQFFPFVWGSSQLIDHPYLRPNAIHSAEAIEDDFKDYMYLAAVRFVKHVKKGPLAETSPMLNDISAVHSWSKVNQGMIKMYQAEVLGKLPIMQHFLFGSLLPFQAS